MTRNFMSLWDRVRKVARLSISLNLNFCASKFLTVKMSIFSLSKYYLHSCLCRQTQFSTSTAFEGVKTAHLPTVLAGIT